MTEVRSLFTATAEANDGPRSDSGLLTESSSQLPSDQTHQYGLFATIDYNEGDVILTESPIVVLSHLLDTSSSGQKPAMASATSVGEVIRSQFKDASFKDVKASSKKDDEGTREKNKASPIKDIYLPKTITDKLNSSFHSVDAQVKKLRGMILAAATYAAYPPSDDDSKKKLFELYHPSIESEVKVDEESQQALDLAKLAVESCKELAAPDTSLDNLLNSTDAKESTEVLLKAILIYSCNAFEGGRIYYQLSRVNHSCNPNAVVVEGDTTDVSVLKAACTIKKGSEITISYLGKELYAGYPIRQRKLRIEKHFVCMCTRCTGLNGEEVSSKSTSVSLDLASRIPCPICHPRTSRYLDEDLMFDEDEDDLQISYALAENGMTPEERRLYCISCGGLTSVNVDGSVRKKKEGMTIKYMCMAEEKVFDRIDSNKFSAAEEYESNNEQDVDRSLLQMAMATCGAKHWTTHILSLAVIEETLANLQSTLLSIDPEEDENMMEDVFSDIAECADGCEKAFEYAKSLRLNLNPAHLLFDYVLGLSRTLVGLGDAKSQKYGSDWIARVEDYANKFEGEATRKVVFAIKNAWTRDDNTGNTKDDAEGSNQVEAKRRKVG
jgi:hypothetical protein